MSRRIAAFSLLELVVVLSILAALASLLSPIFSGTIQDANATVTQRSLTTIRDAMLDYWADTKHIPMDGITTTATQANRLSVDWLFSNPSSGDTLQDFDPHTQIGWRGRYLAASTGNEIAAGKWLVVDAWNQEIVTQLVDPAAQMLDLRIVSGGPNGVIDIPAGTATTALTDLLVGDDLYVALQLR